MHRLSTLAATVTFGFSLACAGLIEPEPDIAHPHHHESDGIGFDYPGNWTVERSDLENGLVQFDVEGPSDALVIVQVLPPGTPLDLDVFATTLGTEVQTAIASASGGLLELDPPTVSPVSRTIAGAECDGRKSTFIVELFGIEVPFAMNFYHRDGPKPVIVYDMLADEERGRVQPGFDLVFDSLKILE